MPIGDIEVYHYNDAWHVRVEGNVEPAYTTDTRRGAEEQGRRLQIVQHQMTGRPIQLIVRNENGQIGQQSTYPRSEDPASSPG